MDAVEEQGPPSRRIEEAQKGGDMLLVHWAPQDALGWSCVSCRRSWVRDDVLGPWLAAGGVVAHVDADGIRAYRDGHLEVRLGAEPVELEEPKTPVCKSCGRSDIRLDSDGRVLSHGDAETGARHCRGRGYMPRWT